MVFGSVVPDANKAYQAIEKEVVQKFPSYAIQWAFTSNTIRNKLRKKGKQVFSATEAIENLRERGFDDVSVQSFKIIPGKEYLGMVESIAVLNEKYSGEISIRAGKPLLFDPDDLPVVAKLVLGLIPKERNANEPVLLMGHGTSHPANVYYPALQYYLSRLDPNIYLATIEGKPTLEEIMGVIQRQAARKVWLVPLLAAVGKHVKEDMLGAGKDSWKSKLEQLGLQVEAMPRGLAEYPKIVNYWLGKLEKTISIQPNTQ